MTRYFICDLIQKTRTNKAAPLFLPEKKNVKLFYLHGLIARKIGVHKNIWSVIDCHLLSKCDHLHQTITLLTLSLERNP